MLRKYPSVRRWEDTDDVLQMALLRLHRSLSEVRPESTRQFFGLAVTMIRRQLIDLSRHYLGKLGLGANYDSRGGGRAADDSGGPLVTAAGMTECPENLEYWTAFHEAVEALPADEREVVSLIWYGGMSKQDLAETLNINRKTVTRRLARARLLLHECLTNPNISLTNGEMDQ